MHRRRPRECAPRPLRCVNLILVALSLAAPIVAQQSRQSQPQQRPASPRRSTEIEDNLRSREFDLRTIEHLARRRDLAEKAEKEERQRREQAEFRKNLARLRELNDELRQAGAGRTISDYKRLAASAGEMKKRASRLKSTLPKPEGEGKPRERATDAPEIAEPQTLLAQLNALVDKLILNPVVREAKVIEAASTADARRDLEGIIHLSEALRRRADELREGH